MSQQDMFAAQAQMPSETTQTKKLVRRDAITDGALAHFQEPYAEKISKEDIFYYIYGLLHSEEYRERYADNLSKQLPRIPRMKTYADFAAFSKAGRDLADLHLNYETVSGREIFRQPERFETCPAANHRWRRRRLPCGQNEICQKRR